MSVSTCAGAHRTLDFRIAKFQKIFAKSDKPDTALRMFQIGEQPL